MWDEAENRMQAQKALKEYLLLGRVASHSSHSDPALVKHIETLEFGAARIAIEGALFTLA